MVLKEMNRLEEHTSSTTEAYQQLSGPSPNIVRVCFFNVQSLWATHRRDVENDRPIHQHSFHLGNVRNLAAQHSMQFKGIWLQHQQGKIIGKWWRCCLI